jgi:DNA-binding NarL/FixJ family response regulator
MKDGRAAAAVCPPRAEHSALGTTPLIGAAVYEDIPAHERSLAHEHVARLLHERGHPAGAVAVHLAMAPARGEEWVCDTLETAVLRERGDSAGAWQLLEAVEDPGDASDAARYLLDALAEVLLAEERFEEALAVAEDSERRFGFLVHPIDTPARSHRAVALYHLGRRDEALTLAAEALELARRWGAPTTLGRALRILGTLERDAGLEHLQEAVEVTAPSPARLEHAKALAALGTGLRAARRPTEAREPLRRALDLADTLGAAGVLEHARYELHAAGGRPRTKALAGPAALTPSERRVTERAAAGQTNRDIAEALFVTAKTVERHLSSAYRKLGVSSRHELADKLEARAPLE